MNINKYFENETLDNILWFFIVLCIMVFLLYFNDKKMFIIFNLLIVFMYPFIYFIEYVLSEVKK